MRMCRHPLECAPGHISVDARLLHVRTPLRLCLPEVVCGVWEAGSGTRRVGLPPQCQSGVKGTPTADSLIAARLDSFRVYDYNYSLHTCYILDVQTWSLQSVSRTEDSRGLQFVSAILSSLDNFPAQPCTCRRHIGAVSTSRLTFQPHWLLVVRSASILVLGNQPSASTSPLTYSYLSIRIWPTTSQTSHRHYTNTKSS